MRFVVSQKAFADSLKSAFPMVGAKSLPVLNTFKIEAKDDLLKVTGYNLDQALVLLCPAEIQENGVACFPGNLSDIISKLPSSNPIGIAVDKNFEILIKSGKYESTLQGMDAIDYPELFKLNDTVDVDSAISCEEFQEALKTISFAVSEDQTKQVLTGIKFQAKGGELKLAATDGHRLAMTSIKMEEEFECLVPGETVKQVSKILDSKSYETITLKSDGRYAIFGLEQRRFYTRLLDGQYPNVNQLIPESFKVTAKMDRKELLSVLDRVSTISNKDRHSIVKLSFNKEELFVSANVPDVGKVVESMVIESNESLDLAINSKYLLEGLKAVDSEMIIFEMSTNYKPILLKSLEYPEWLYLAMPIQLRD